MLSDGDHEWSYEHIYMVAFFLLLLLLLLFDVNIHGFIIITSPRHLLMTFSIHSSSHIDASVMLLQGHVLVFLPQQASLARDFTSKYMPTCYIIPIRISYHFLCEINRKLSLLQILVKLGHKTERMYHFFASSYTTSIKTKTNTQTFHVTCHSISHLFFVVLFLCVLWNPPHRRHCTFYSSPNCWYTSTSTYVVSWLASQSTRKIALPLLLNQSHQ